MKNGKLEKIRFLSAVASGEVEPVSTPEQLLDKWFDAHSEQEAFFFIIWHRMNPDKSIKEFKEENILAFYQDDILYRYNSPWIYRDTPAGILWNNCTPKVRLCCYFEKEHELIYYNKLTNEIRVLTDLKDTPK